MRSLKSVLAAAGVAAALLTAPVTVPAASAAVPVPPTPSGLPTAIEPLARYVAQTSCNPVTKSGTARLRDLITRTYPGIYAGTTYACGTDGPVSEHYDGRAIDWMASVRVPSQAAKAKALLGWLLATDRHGNQFARARRLGVQYLIYNNKIWSTWNGRWNAYQNCASTPSRARDSYCHRNHVHISLSWDGAFGRTSFWTKRVAAFDYGPCRARDLNWSGNWSHRNTVGCPWYPKVTARRGASVTKRNLVTYSGAYLIPGLTGPAVTSVQAALHVPLSGVYDLRTRAAVIAFEKRHRLYPSGTLDAKTWRTLLAVVR